MAENTPEVNEEVDVNALIREAFQIGIEEELEEDAIKMEMISSGATFKNVTRLYNQFMIDAGLVMSKDERDEAVEEALKDADLLTEAGFDSAVNAVLDAVTGSTDRSAAALVRAYGKKNGIDVFAKPKAEGGTRNPFTTLFYNGLRANPHMTHEQLKGLIAGLEEKHQVNPLRWLRAHDAVRQLVNDVANTVKV